MTSRDELLAQIEVARKAAEVAERRAESFDRMNPRRQAQLTREAQEARLLLIELERASVRESSARD